MPPAIVILGLAYPRKRQYAVLCVSQWSVRKLVKIEDVVTASKMYDEDGEEEMEEGWDAIIIKE